MKEAGSQRFRVIEHMVIPLRDGCRLAARIWLPESAGKVPVPAVLEYLPYRKRDATSVRDEIVHGHFASRGYACLRVDIRGNGDSDGLMEDEYTPQELADGKEVIEWVAQQPWCSGTVGIMGISWGGFNGLQIAALEPAPLKAVVTVCSTDDRYADDIHFKGGCLLNDNMTWSQQMLAYSSRPPDPALVGDDWRKMWLDRLAHMPVLASTWLRHQRRDAYWAHGSVCEDYSRIKAAVLAVGGWADAYSNAIPRLLSGLSSPCRAIIGPWEHAYPHQARIAPAVDFLGEVTRWWDQWLKGVESGAMDAPKVRVFILASEPPSPCYASRKGRWISTETWPPPDTMPLELHLGRGVLARTQDKERIAIVTTPQHHGGAGGAFCPGMRIDEELPGDQSYDDSLCTVFDGAVLEEGIEILGAPICEFAFSADQPVCKLVVRLCDLHPEEGSSLITWAPLNLTHRESHASPQKLRPGKRYRARVQLNDIAYALPAGHRLRLAVATTNWPMLWPDPRSTTVELHLKGCHIRIPVRRILGIDEDAFPPPPATVNPVREILSPENRRIVTASLTPDGSVVSETTDDFGLSVNPATGLRSGSSVHQKFSILPADPSSAVAEADWIQILERSEWKIRTETSTKMTSDSEHFYITATLRAFENEEVVLERTWADKILRDHQ